MADSDLVTIISLAVTVFFMLGVPVFLVIAYWIIGCSLVIGMPLDNIGATLSDVFTDGFALLAMPLFILTGDLVSKSGIALRMSNFAYACLGWLRGGLAMASIGACGLFAAISGSNSATTATIGSMLHPEMVKGGYDERFSAATTAAGGTVGIIIPPSLIFIVYGFLLNLPISELFIAGIIPGALMVIGMQLVCYIICKYHGWGHLNVFNIGNIMKTAVGSWLGFAVIALVMWGIYTGKFSPTEAAGVTVGFCILLGIFSKVIYDKLGYDDAKTIDAKSTSYQQMLLVKGFKISDLPSVTMRSAQITGFLAPLIAVSVVMQQIMSVLGVEQYIAEFVTSMGGYYPVLLTSMLIIFIAGMILESLPVTILFAPILAPVAVSIGVDPIHFAVVFLMGASIGFITPPYGLNLYVASGVTGVPYFRMLRYSTAYLVSLLVVWFAVTLMPSLALWLLELAK